MTKLNVFVERVHKLARFSSDLNLSCFLVPSFQSHLSSFRLMRLAVRLLRPAPNQNIKSPKLWQDPVLGYWETHGKTEFLPGEQYNLTDEEKKAVLWRYRVKEILKKEYLRREFDPNNFKYKVRCSCLVFTLNV